ncbi:MAG: hypothetical protein JWO62_3576 [Acidimicrobiaceae bacterium]|nr:hypothetical protein [Acidimicrobiaceae bacterium]
MELPRTVVICSFRLGGTDGVSIEAAKWSDALQQLGCRVVTLAGEGAADVVLPGLASSATEPPSPGELRDVFASAELVIVENLCSLPLNPPAAKRVAEALRDRPAVLHHHDLASQRNALAHLGPPPNDEAWLHVCVNQRSTAELAAHGYSAVTSYNTFDPDPPAGLREPTRTRAGVEGGGRLLLQPTRAIARKNVPAGVALAERIGATFWLLGPSEDGYGPRCDRVLAAAQVPVVRGPGPTRPGHEIADAYAACDAVVLASTWEGFGNPALESATHRRPLAIGPYPVARELRRYGFSWFDANDPGVLLEWMNDPDLDLLDRNAEVVRRHFSLTDLPGRLSRLIARLPGEQSGQRSPRPAAAPTGDRSPIFYGVSDARAIPDPPGTIDAQ